MKEPVTNPSYPLNALAQSYANAIGDYLPPGADGKKPDVGFVLLMFQGGKNPGMCYQTNCEANAVLPMLNQFCVDLESAKVPPDGNVKTLVSECGETIVKVVPLWAGFLLLMFEINPTTKQLEVAGYSNVAAENTLQVARAFLTEVQTALRLAATTATVSG